MNVNNAAVANALADGIEITRPARANSIKLHATVPSRSRTGVSHIVTYIRKPGMERWTCTCEDQNIIKTAKRRNCYHIKKVRGYIEN